ncbi:c-type cytochrome biogenesis protein CcmI [Salinisphaera sp. Q1T1-3]|uniref:c-type cytochrome biogenesis protein CcmI n=1 Tax=Salinisphaera sp. Q1T1-3 TaxID=2321229 RepID=UPI000E71A6E7|nr:c-type cytochrome biogenesis protein CcmI [Salinisphaera sp. Q1T1-3]RJS92068.1 c-type cytochrome biogenesis protein CcmI [Salinisphaera sp. Q1T1-3]
MIVFTLVATAMVIVCLGFALVPMWRTQSAADVDRRRAANIEVYRQRCRELDADVAAERISAAEAAAEKDALGARLLADVDAATEMSVSGRAVPVAAGRPWLASSLATVLIVVAGSAGYLWLGNPGALEDSGMPNVDQMVGQLEARVAEDPNDRGARLMLAEAYRSRGQYKKAAATLHQINAAASPPDADLLVAEAQARLAAGQDLQGDVGQLFQQALVQDPTNPQALWFLGLRASEAGKPKAAVRFWDRLLAQDLPPKVENMVRSRRNALAGDVPSL